ncbi:MAG TPA: site-specific DNA-methyltransferase [Gemmatimonadales bacterium]|nr:site-specific DNA-methyltransferase [Gemmatimonadales bacterium]
MTDAPPVADVADALRIIRGDNLAALRSIPDAAVRLIYVDPPFNTGVRRGRRRLRTVRDDAGGRVGFGGERFRDIPQAVDAWSDRWDDYLAFLAPRLVAARRVLAADGSLFVHLDQREVHYVKVLLDAVFGRECFRNEIIWAYDFGARPRRAWPAKHDTILWYSRDPKRWVFHADAVDRVPYLAPRLQTPARRARGKPLTDVWWHTIVPTRSRERTGYPTQKPVGLLERIVRVHSDPGDLLLDFFAGSGSFGEAALRHGRRVMLVDQSAAAVRVMRKRLAR